MTRPRRHLLLAAPTAVTLLAAGCYSYPPLPEPVEGDSYTAAAGHHRGLPTDCAMLTADLAREIALQNNPDFRSAQHAMVAANARFYRSLTAHLPTVDAGYDITESRFTDDSPLGSTGLDYATTKTSRMSADWLVFNGLMQTMDTLATRHDARQVEAMERDARRLLTESVGIAYQQVLLSREGIKIAKADEEFNRKLLNETELKYEAGAVSMSEVLNFRIRVNNARNDLVAREHESSIARAVLAALMSVTEGTIAPELFPPLPEVAETMRLGLEISLDMALANRPDLAAYREALTATEYRLYARYGAFSPQLWLHADFGWMRTDPEHRGRWHLRSRTQDRYLNYGATAQWEIFDGGRRIFDLREAQAMVAESQEAVTKQWVKVVAEVRQACDNLVQRQDQLAIATETLDLVTKTRDLVAEEYQAGSASLTRLNEAQRDLIVTELTLASARINLANAKLRLEASTASDPLVSGKPVAPAAPAPVAVPAEPIPAAVPADPATVPAP